MIARAAWYGQARHFAAGIDDQHIVTATPRQ